VLRKARRSWVLRPNVCNMCAYTILRNGSIHWNIAPMLAWCANCGWVSNEITATSPAFGQIEPSLVQSKTRIGLFMSFHVLNSLYSNTETKYKVSLF
jgi:hypothetical protein